MPEQHSESEYWDPHHNELCDGGVTVAEFQTEEECNFAAYLLREQGIQSGILIPGRRLDLRSPQLRVSPDDEQAARHVLAQPVSLAKRAEYDAEPDGEPFAVPRCPKCGSQEVALIAVGTGNDWRCDHCAQTWTDTLEVPGEP